MRKSALFAGMIAAALHSFEVNAATFRHGEWFGKSRNESCHVDMHVQEGLFFFVEGNWEKTFWLGVYGNGIESTEGTKMVGAISFDNNPPIVLQGEMQENRLYFQLQDSQLLRNAFIRSRMLQLSWGDGYWLRINLRGSAKAMQWIDMCAEIFWPGAGDAEETEHAAQVEAGIEAVAAPMCNIINQRLGQRVYFSGMGKEAVIDRGPVSDIVTECKWEMDKDDVKLSCNNGTVDTIIPVSSGRRLFRYLNDLWKCE